MTGEITGTRNAMPEGAELVFTGDYLPREPLSPWLESKETLAIGNLECALSGSRTSSDKAYSVTVTQEQLSHVAGSGFAALSLANNHVYDAGHDAFERMLGLLDKMEGIQFYGLRERPFAHFMAAGKKTAIIGCLEPCRSRGPRIFPEEKTLALIGRIKRDYDRIIVTPHWGKEGEYASYPSPKQRRLARRWIEAGAHAVFGHHPHSAHGVERFGDCPVYYSLGNFIFDHEQSASYETAGFGIVVKYKPGGRAGQDGFDRFFIRSGKGKVEWMDEGTSESLDHYIKDISKDLEGEDGLRSYVNWIRAVGPIYGPKSKSSWAKRLDNGSGLKNRIIWIVWSLHPATVALKLGEKYPDKKLSERNQRLRDLLNVDVNR